MENIIKTIADTLRHDLNKLVISHTGAATNAHIWALGSDEVTAVKFEQEADTERALAKLYQKMVNSIPALIEQFGGK